MGTHSLATQKPPRPTHAAQNNLLEKRFAIANGLQWSTEVPAHKGLLDTAYDWTCDPQRATTLVKRTGIVSSSSFLVCQQQRSCLTTQPVVAQRTTASFVEHLRRSSIIDHQTPGALRDPGLCCCLLYTSPSPRDKRQSRMPSSA